MARTPEQLRAELCGLFAFPVTPFTEANQLDLARYREHLRYLLAARPSAMFVCGGTGEFFSLDLAEYRTCIEAAAGEVGGRIPLLAGAGYGTKLAIEFVRVAEKAGADGVLVMPPYLLQAEQEGLSNHYRAVSEATHLGIVIYQRDNAIFAPSTVARLAESRNVIGFKDGHGDMERLTRIRQMVGDRMVYMNGMPTAELSAQAFQGIGVRDYSSAVFNFVPEVSRAFYRALTARDEQEMGRLLEAFYRPFADLRDRKRGYAVALIKAGLNVMGKAVGRVRPPLVYPGGEEEAQLKTVIERGLAATRATARA